MSGLGSELQNEVPCFPVEAAADHMTTQYLYGASCGMCGKVLYVSQDTLERIDYATRSGLDNPLRCENCESEYDDLALEG